MMIVKLKTFPKLKMVKNLVESLTLAQFTKTTINITTAAISFWATSDNSSQVPEKKNCMITNF